MAKIITIGREYGSGGRLIGRMVAERLGIEFYDKGIIAMVAQKGGYAIEFVEDTGEYVSTGSLLFGLAGTGLYRQSAYTQETLPAADKIQILQSNIIREIADKGPGVIVGRCADYILRERRDCLNVFIHADIAHKRERGMRYFGIGEAHVEKELKRRDKQRANHYEHYTDREWGLAKNYHLTIDSGYFGVEGSVELIVHAAGE